MKKLICFVVFDKNYFSVLKWLCDACFCEMVYGATKLEADFFMEPWNFPWSFFLMRLRIGYFDPYLNDTTDSVLFFVPHILIAFWGITVGLSSRSDQQNRTTFIKWSFFTLLFAMIIFDIVFSFWGVYADRNLDINPNRSYLLSAITASVFFSWVAALIIVTPFFIGYVPAKIVRYISDCTKMKDPKQHLLR